MNPLSLIKKHLRSKARIYILPTRMGGYLNGLIFLMFLLSIGYSNNLLLIFTLFLFGLNLIWVLQTHFYLHALKFESIDMNSGHADESLSVNIFWRKAPTGILKWELKLIGEIEISLSGLIHSQIQTKGLITIPKRGRYKWQHLKIFTDMPFGLYRSWIYVPIKLENFVYPKKIRDFSEPKFTNFLTEGEERSEKKGSHDILNLAPYQGEEYRRISWKHYARTGELVVKEGEELIQRQVKFHLHLNELDKEFILSNLTSQLVYCRREKIPFSLETSHRSYPTGNSDKHLYDCLKELATC